MSKKKLTNTTPPKASLVSIDQTILNGQKPHVGITYLEKNNFGLKHLFKCHKGDQKILNDLINFIEKCKHYTTMTQLIESHQPHGKGPKNKDHSSISKLKELKNAYNIEPGEMIHLHTLTNGNGKFVLHGFVLQNVFEIVWLDCNHEKHK